MLLILRNIYEDIGILLIEIIENEKFNSFKLIS